MSDPRAGGWGRGAEPLPPARPEAPGTEARSPRRRSEACCLLPVSPPLRLGPPGYVTRDLPFPLRHGAATPALPPALRRQATPGSHGPASRSRRRRRNSLFAAPAPRRPFIHSRVRVFAPPAIAERGTGARARRRGPPAWAHRSVPGFSRSLAGRHVGGSVFLTPLFLVIYLSSSFSVHLSQVYPSRRSLHSWMCR